MKYQLTTEADGVRIGLQETLGFKDHQEFRRLLSDVLARKPSRVKVDLSALAMVDSAGLGLLVILNERVKQGGGSVTLSRPNEDVKRLLAIVEFDKLFAIDAAA
jgi:HptB-dependent secretion and biofilm anti anti-sigma factor